MPSILDELPTGAGVLVVRLRSLGDCVLTTPALHLLKSYRPDLEIGVVVENRFAAIFEENPDVTAILPPSIREAARFGAKLTVNFHGGQRSAVLTALSMTRRRAGFAHYRHQWVYNVSIPRAQQILGEERKVHTAEHLAAAMFYLGVPRTEIPRALLFTDEADAARDYAVIHPMASKMDKTWPAERFLELARWLRDERGLEPLVIGGAQDDLSAFKDFRRAAGAGLDRVKMLMSRAKLFVGNDSGPAHMAAAFGVPVVVLYGSSDPVIWAPWRTRHESIVAAGGLADVDVARVITAVDRVMEAAA